MYQYLTEHSSLPLFYQYPKFLLDEEGLNDTDRTVYMLLLDRARLSEANRWVDEQGRVYEIYTVASLAGRLHKGTTVVKSALRKLEEHSLIRRIPVARGQPCRIYVRIPESAVPVKGSGCNREVKRNRRSDQWVFGYDDYSYQEGESL